MSSVASPYWQSGSARTLASTTRVGKGRFLPLMRRRQPCNPGTDDEDFSRRGHGGRPSAGEIRAIVAPSGERDNMSPTPLPQSVDAAGRDLASRLTRRRIE